MKIFIRAIAAVMLIAMFAVMFTACGKKDDDQQEEETQNYINEKLIGTWVGDDGEEDCTWVFRDDHTCTLSGGVNHLDNVNGTYAIYNLENGQIDIRLDGWDKAVTFSYTCTDIAMILSDFDTVYSCNRQ